jgi:hypothetical protein
MAWALQRQIERIGLLRHGCTATMPVSSRRSLGVPFACLLPHLLEVRREVLLGALSRLFPKASYSGHTRLLLLYICWPLMEKPCLYDIIAIMSG